MSSSKVEYLLVGGYSVVYYGYPRSTGDIDIWIAVSRKNAARISTALTEFGFDAEHVAPKNSCRKERC